jgi:prophage maintenance system killer protein
MLNELPSPSQSISMANAALKRLRAALEDNGDIDWNSVAAEAMLDLLEAHPFKDGNGRLSRAVVTWLLIQGGYKITSDPGIFCRQHIDTYYRAVREALEQRARGKAQFGSSELWSQFFSQMVRTCFERG